MATSMEHYPSKARVNPVAKSILSQIPNNHGRILPSMAHCVVVVFEAVLGLMNCDIESQLTRILCLTTLSYIKLLELFRVILRPLTILFKLSRVCSHLLGKEKNGDFFCNFGRYVGVKTCNNYQQYSLIWYMCVGLALDHIKFLIFSDLIFSICSRLKFRFCRFILHLNNS